jgi:hypothetical protein
VLALDNCSLTLALYVQVDAVVTGGRGVRALTAREYMRFSRKLFADVKFIETTDPKDYGKNID